MTFENIVIVLSIVCTIAALVVLFCHVYEQWRAYRRFRMISDMHNQIDKKIKEHGDDDRT